MGFIVSKRQLDIGKDGQAKVISLRLPDFLVEHLHKMGQEEKMGHTQYVRDLIQADYLKKKRRRKKGS